MTGSSSDWTPSPEKKKTKKEGSSPGTTFSTASFAQKRNALNFYRSAEKGTRSISSMNSRFRFIKNEVDMNSLRRFTII